MKHLVSFLGTGAYEDADYRWAGRGDQRTCYATEAIATLWGAKTVTLLATREARERHAMALDERLRDAGCEVRVTELPDGRRTEEQWAQFTLLQDALAFEPDRARGSTVTMLDITHGFRAQPFMAGAALAVYRTVAHRRAAPHVVYAEFDRADASGQIWTLDLFTEIVDWSQALGLFQRTAVAGPLIELAQGARASRDDALPDFAPLVSAIARFANDLATVRVGSLVTGFSRGGNDAISSTQHLREEIGRARRAALERQLPPLALVLDELEQTLHPLVAPRLGDEDGARALAALAALYVKLERYPEAIITAREARINRYAPSPEGVEIGDPGFDQARRQTAEAAFHRRDKRHEKISEIRNDISHGGYRRAPNTGEHLKRRVIAEVEALAALPPGSESPEAEPEGRTVFVSRHRGAWAWAREEGVVSEGDDFVEHLDIERVRAGDVIIGSLPVDLAAEVCRRGARYRHLSLELPERLRGQELNAAQLRARNARIVEHVVRRVGS